MGPNMAAHTLARKNVVQDGINLFVLGATAVEAAEAFDELL